MSYILDALKKSEEERKKHQGQKESPYPHLSDQPKPLRKSRIVPALIITTSLLLIIIIMGIGMWFTIRGGKQEQNIASSGPPELIQTGPAQAENNSQARSADDHDIQNKKSTIIEKQIDPTTAIKSDKEAVVQSIPAPASDQTDQKEELVQTDRVPFLSELPFSTQSMLPEMEYRGHVYSPTPEKRMIMINAVIVREGDTIAPDLSLTEITENGLIMSFRGTDFQVELFRSGSG